MQQAALPSHNRFLSNSALANITQRIYRAIHFGPCFSYPAWIGHVFWIAALQCILLMPTAAHADWTQQQSNTTRNLSGVIFGGGQFVAVGASGTILTSQDDVNWTSQSSGVMDDLALIAYGNGTYVIAASTYVLTSSDAINWAKHPVNWCYAQANCGSTNSITYGNGLFVAVGGAGVYNIQVSTDGINWTYVGTGGAPGNPGGWLSTNRGWTSVAFGNDRFVVVGPLGKISTSADGINWSVSQNGGVSLNSVAYGSGAGFIATGEWETILSSMDGVNWSSKHYSSTSSSNFTALGYGGGRYVFYDGWGGIAYTQDGANLYNANGSGYNAIAYGNGKFVVVGNSGNIYSSIDSTAPSKINQTIGAISLSKVGGIATVSATATSGLAVSFSSTTPSICTVSGNTLTGISVGTCIVAANQAGNASYNAAPQVTQSFAVTSSTTCSYSLNSTSLSAGAVAVIGNVNVTVASGCAWNAASTVSWVTVTSGASGNGNGSVTYSVAANSGSLSRTGTLTIAGQTFTITQAGAGSKASQTISFSAYTPTVAIGGTGTVSATATSGLPVTYSSTTPSVCTVSGSTVTGISAGTCTIAADQAGNASYSAATQVTQNITSSTGTNDPALTGTWLGSGANNAGETITFTSTTITQQGTNPNSNWCQATYSYTTSGNTSYNFVVITPDPRGTCASSGTVTYSIAGNILTTSSGIVGTWTRSSGIGKASQTISFSAYTPTVAIGGTGTVSATATSGLPVTYSSTPASVCTVSSTGTVTGISAGTCTIAANQLGDASYSAATQVTQTITIASAPAAISPSSASANASGQTSTISVTVDTGNAWTATSHASWITVTSGSSGSGNGSVVYSVAANTGTIARTGTLTIAGQTFTVTQAGASSTFTGIRSEYQVTQSGDSYTVTDLVAGRDGTTTITSADHLAFSDMTVNLTVQAKAASIAAADLQRLQELYVAFFNRVPAADGLAYWIDQFNAGSSINQIADSFYAAGVANASLTGFLPGMSSGDFVHVIYRNVLGRPEGAGASGLAYWSGELDSGRETRGSLAASILNSAHSFKGDATYGWVADLLDNKVAVANQFSVTLGLTHNTPEASISNGMAIAAAVTPTSTAAALALIGVVSPTSASLTSPSNGGTLSGSTQTFTWNDVGAALYYVYVGSSVGASDLGKFPAAGTTATTTTVSGLPTDGRTLYVTLYSNVGGAWKANSYTYTAANTSVLNSNTVGTWNLYKVWSVSCAYWCNLVKSYDHIGSMTINSDGSYTFSGTGGFDNGTLHPNPNGDGGWGAIAGVGGSKYYVYYKSTGTYPLLLSDGDGYNDVVGKR